MPRRRRKKTTPTSYDWSNDPDSVQIKPEWFNDISPEEMQARIEEEEKALEKERKWQEHLDAIEDWKEQVLFQKWKSKKGNSNKTLDDYRVATAPKGGIGWCGFGK